MLRRMTPEQQQTRQPVPKTILGRSSRIKIIHGIDALAGTKEGGQKHRVSSEHSLIDILGVKSVILV